MVLFTSICSCANDIDTNMSSFNSKDAENNAVIESTNAFAFDLYKQLSKQDGENIIFSPFCIYNALLIANEGAGGNTKLQISKAIYQKEEDDQKNKVAFANILNNITNTDTTQLKLSIANACWVQENYPIKETFRKNISTYYSAEINSLDFIKKPSESSNIINDWINKKTYGYISNIISPSDIKKRTRLIISNAIYFNGKWSNPFEEENNRKDLFYLSAQNQDSIWFMNQTNEFRYFENEQIQMIELPYSHSDYSMIVFLPKAIDGLKMFNESLNLKSFNEYIDSLKTERVKISMPKFKIEGAYDLIEPLKALGINDAFNLNSNFNNITDKDQFMINLIRHKAIIEVQEKRTIAAAGLVVEMTLTSAQYFNQKIIKVNKPFLFAIVNNTNGMILFLGTLNNVKQ